MCDHGKRTFLLQPEHEEQVFTLVDEYAQISILIAAARKTVAQNSYGVCFMNNCYTFGITTRSCSP